jgi:hypothetical protein
MTVITAATEANNILAALTPAEKWQAIRGLGSGFSGEQAFILLCGAALFVLTALLIAVSYNRRKKDRRATGELFNTYADERGLSGRERHILLEIATRARLKRNESIFTLADTFNEGAAKATEDALASQGQRRGRHLGAELAALRKKLGFERRISDLPGSHMKSSKPGSRQIPVGKELQIIPRDNHELDGIEATVIKNDEIELAVKLATPLEADPGDLCRVHYYFRGSVWEFNASVISCHGGILVLTHSYDVRFVNRRRFLRVPVSKPGFIASFPFARTFPASSNDAEWTKHDSMGAVSVAWGPPEFIPGVVTELAGPGLRIEAPLEVNVGDRVAVVIKLSEEPASRQQDASTRSAPVQKSKRTEAKVVEAVGEVRHVKATENGFSMAVELTGLSDSNVNELVRETNSASFELDARNPDAQASAGSETSGQSEIVKQMAVQGV